MIHQGLCQVKITPVRMTLGSLSSRLQQPDLRGVIFVVYNLHPVQKPARAGLTVVMSDPQFPQGLQVNRRDDENILLEPATKGREMSQVLS